MYWILPPMTEEQYCDHVAHCERLLELKAPGRYLFTPQRSVPSVKPELADFLYIRVGRDIVAYHIVIGTNRAFDPGGGVCERSSHRATSQARCVGWQCLYQPETIELTDPIPGPHHINFGQLNDRH